MASFTLSVKSKAFFMLTPNTGPSNKYALSNDTVAVRVIMANYILYKTLNKLFKLINAFINHTTFDHFFEARLLNEVVEKVSYVYDDKKFLSQKLICGTCFDHG